MLKIGYKASAEQFGPRDLVEYAVLAEEVGLDSVWVSDHFQPWRHIGGHAPQALPWLAAVGERTERVLLGTSVLTPTFRYNPAVLAQVFATLGSLYPGRIALGVGSGEALNEIAVGSVPAAGADGAAQWPEFKERSARLRESIALMRRLWTEDRVTFEGSYYQTKDATIYDKPGEPIPVYMAAGGPQMAKSVGRHADGFICTSGKGEELYAALIWHKSSHINFPCSSVLECPSVPSDEEVIARRMVIVSTYRTRTLSYIFGVFSSDTE